MNYEPDAHYLENIARGLFAVASAIRALGNGNTATQMGAIETLGVAIKEGFERLAMPLDDIASGEARLEVCAELYNRELDPLVVRVEKDEDDR